MSQMAQELQVLDWGVYYPIVSAKALFINSLGHHEYKIPLYNKNLKSKIQYTTIHKEMSYCEILVYIEDKLIFVWEIIYKQPIPQGLSNKIQLFLEMCVLQESLIYDKYPTCFPLLYPINESLLNLNTLILKSTPLNCIFINGQPGTGKRTFFILYLLYQYNTLYQFPKEIPKILEVNVSKEYRYIYIHEIALLTLEEQKEIFAKLHTKRSILQSKLHIKYVIASSYAISTLIENQFLLKELGDILNQNLYKLLSLKNRKEELVDIKNFILHFKKHHYISTILNKMLNVLQVENYSYNLSEILNPICFKSLTSQYNNSEKLRDKIAELEIEFIVNAYNRVGSSQNKIAQLLGISRGSLQHKIRKYNLPYTEWID